MAGVGVAAGLAVLRIALVGRDSAATLVETRLTGGDPSLTGTAVVALGERAARAQLLVYTQVTGAAQRYPDLLGAGRELALVACVVLLTALVAAAVHLMVRPVAVAFVLVALAASGSAVDALATFGPGLLGVAWLAVGGALLLGTRTPVRVLGVVAVSAGVLTAPLLAVPVAVFVVCVTARRWAPVAEVAAALGSAILVLAWLSPTPAAGAAVGSGRVVLVALAGGIVVIAIALRGFRAAAVTTASVALLAVTPWTGADTLVPAVVVAVLLLGTAIADEFVRQLDRRRVGVRRGCSPSAAVAAGVLDSRSMTVQHRTGSPELMIF